MSCEKEAAPQPSTTSHGNISYFAKASGNKASVKSASVSSTVEIAWSSASIYVEKISFTGKGESQIDTIIVVEKNMNIFSPDALAGVIQLRSGSYKDVKVKLFLKKSPKSELAFNVRGTFTNTKGIKDSLIVASSLPFEANLGVNDITVNPSDNYKAIFNFDLDKILTGISTQLLQTAPSHVGLNNLRTYAIWKGGSADVPLYAQVTNNWQTVASVVISKQ